MVRPHRFRERAEELERASLSTWAVLSAETKGRDRYEEPDPLRTAFQVDAHRITTSAAFRGLAGKAAWLPSGPAPNRLATTLEVARLAGTLARALRLNTDLTEAIALGHALGAPPFGPAGEAALTEFGYDRPEQSLRVVERLEVGGAGLNLTWETRDGILTAVGAREPATLEGQAVRLAARVAEATIDPPVTALSKAGDLFGADPSGWGDRLVERVAGESLERPQLRLGDRMAKALDALVTAAAAERRQRAGDDHHRAIHCLQSLAIYALEHGEAAGDPEARRGVVDSLAGHTDREIVEAYRARFEPS